MEYTHLNNVQSESIAILEYSLDSGSKQTRKKKLNLQELLQSGKEKG